MGVCAIAQQQQQQQHTDIQIRIPCFALRNPNLWKALSPSVFIACNNYPSLVGPEITINSKSKYTFRRILVLS
ncbi:hypothetical protein V2J09_012621 [Rumex salicifolius]